MYTTLVLTSCGARIYSLVKVLETRSPAGIRESYRWGFTKLVKLSICALISNNASGRRLRLVHHSGYHRYAVVCGGLPCRRSGNTMVREIFARGVGLTRGHPARSSA